MNGSSAPIAKSPCIFGDCGKGATSRYKDLDVPICQSHAILIWAHVQEEVDARNGRAAIKRTRSADQVGWIYYLMLDGIIKIGYASNVELRLRDYPPSSQLLAVHQGTRSDEIALHQRFARHLVGGREWFRSHGEIHQHLQEVLMDVGMPIADPFIRRRELAVQRAQSARFAEQRRSFRDASEAGRSPIRMSPPRR